MSDLPNVIANSCQRELRAICVILCVTIDGSDRTGGSVRAAETVHANDKKPGDIKSSSIASQQGTPPVTDIGTSCEGMTDDHDIVSVWGERALSGVRNRDVVEDIARLQSEFRYDSNFLVWDESGKGILLL